MGYGFPSGNIFAPAVPIGGNGGGEFTECKTDKGLLVKKLGVWYSGKALQAIQVTYTDDSVGPIHGTAHQTYSDITFAPDEIVTKASLWGDGAGKRSGHIQLTTNQNQHLDAGKDVKGQDEYPVQLGSGILAGVCGRKGYEIDLLALIFLRPINVIKITDLDFGDLPKGPDGPRSKILQKATQYNKTGKDLNWTFSNALQQTNTKTISSTTTNTFGVKVTAGVEFTVTSKLPIIGAGATAKLDVETAWSIAWTKMTQTATTEQITLTWGISGTMAKDAEPVYCTASAVYGEHTFPYTSKTTLSFVNPAASLTYTEKGTFKAKQWAEATAKAENSKGEVPTTPTDTPGKAPALLKAAPAPVSGAAAGTPGEAREAANEAPAPAPAPGFSDRTCFLIRLLLCA